MFPTGGGQRSGVPAPGQGYSILRDRWRLLGLKVRVPPSEESVTCGKTTASEYGDLGNVDVLLFFSLRQASASLALAAMS